MCYILWTFVCGNQVEFTFILSIGVMSRIGIRTHDLSIMVVTSLLAEVRD